MPARAIPGALWAMGCPRLLRWGKHGSPARSGSSAVRSRRSRGPHWRCVPAPSGCMQETVGWLTEGEWSIRHRQENADVADLPSGILTFLFTDIEGSTRLWEEYPEAMRAALLQHDDLLRACIESHGGHVFKTMGDA